MGSGEKHMSRSICMKTLVAHRQCLITKGMAVHFFLTASCNGSRAASPFPMAISLILGEAAMGRILLSPKPEALMK